MNTIRLTDNEFLSLYGQNQADDPAFPYTACHMCHGGSYPGRPKHSTSCQDRPSDIPSGNE